MSYVKGTVLNVKDYGAVGDGTGDDGPAFNSALAAVSATSASRILIPAGTYRVVTPIVIPAGASGITIQGAGEGRTVINSALPVAVFPAIGTVLSSAVAYRTGLSNLTPTADIVSGTRAVDVGAVAANASVGDLVLLGTSLADPDASGFTLGAYRVIVKIAGTVLTLDQPWDYDYPLATTAPKIHVCVTNAGIRVSDLTINLVKGAGGQGISLRMVGGVVDNVTVNGNGTANEGAAGDSFIGINVEGQNIRVTRCTLRDFWESTQSYGYGVLMSGNTIVASENRLERSKHGLTAGSNVRRCYGLIYSNNVAVNALFEAHQSVTDVVISGNYCSINNDPASGNGSAIWARAHRTSVVGNTIVGRQVLGLTTSMSGIKILGTGWDHTVIADNNISGCNYGIKGNEVGTVQHRNLVITGNQITNCSSFGIYLSPAALGLVIADNVFDCTGYGIYCESSSDVTISGNSIRYGTTSYGIGIQVGPALAGDVATYERIAITGNTVKYVAGTGTDGGSIRPAGNLNRLTITGNAIDQGGGSNQQVLASGLTAVATTVTISGNVGNMGANLAHGRTAAPTAGYHFAGETVTHSAPALGLPTGWVCTVSGTPGTWVPLPFLSPEVTAKTAAYSLTAADSTVLANGAFTLTLPSAVTAGAGRMYVVKNTGAGVITIASTAGTIDGAATATISIQYASLTFQSDGTNWWIL